MLYISGRIHYLGWTQLESTLNIIMVWIEKSLFGYDLAIWDLVKRGLSPTCVRIPRFLKLAPWRRVLRTTWYPKCPTRILLRSDIKSLSTRHLKTPFATHSSDMSLPSFSLVALLILGALILRMRGGAKHSPHMRTRETHEKSCKINDLENEPGHAWRLLRYHESPGITFDTTRLHITWFQEVTFHEKNQDFDKIVAR